MVERQLSKLRHIEPLTRAIRRAAPALILLCGLLSACAQSRIGRDGRIENAAFDDVRNTDLSAQHAQVVKNTSGRDAARGNKQRAQLYPGEDPAERRRSDGRPPANAPIRQTSDGYQINFDNANIADAAKAIFGDTLRVPYVVDPRVQGQVTLSTGRAVSRNDLLKSFEAAAKLSNAAMIADADGYRIVPISEAAAGDVGRIDRVRPGDGARAGYGVSVMPLRYTNAEQMLRLLDGFLARAGTVKAEVTGNLILIRGPARDRENIVEVVDTFDVDWLRGQSAGIFPLSHATPDDLIGELTQVMQNEGGTLNASMARFQPVARLNAVLVLTRRFEHLKLVGDWIRRLDQSNAAGQSVYVYQVENGKAADIAQLLNDTFGTGGGSGVSRRTTRSEVAPGRDVSQFGSSGTTGSLGGSRSTSGSQQQPGSGQGQPALGGQATAARQTTASSLAATSTATGSGASANTGTGPDVRIVPDETNNSLIIRASQSEYQKILNALRQIDKPPVQVLINATIAEVTLNDALRYGVQAYLRGKDHAAGYNPGPSALTLAPNFPGLNLIAGSATDPRVILDALSDVTAVKVVSSPSLVVVDNQPATLKVGDEVPITTQQSQSVETTTAPVINTIRYRETGVILKVTPRVNSSGLVTMDVEQEISQVASTTDSSGTATTSLTPTVSQRRIASTIAVYSGQTVALGGLISDQTNSGRKSVPIINKIPIIGDLIGHTEKQSKRTELIVFIKPDIIRNSEDASRVSEDLRGKLKSMAFEVPAPNDAHRPTAAHSIKDRKSY